VGFFKIFLKGSKKMNWFTEALEIYKEVFPEDSILDQKEIHNILMEETGCPSFFNIPKDGNTPQECLKTQLNEFKLKAGYYE